MKESGPRLGGGAFPALGAQLLAEKDGCAVWQFQNESGEGTMTVYDVFPGVMLSFNDFHMAYSKSDYVAGRPLFAIDHCREGRMEYRLGSRYFYLAPGDLSVARQDVLPTLAAFPTGHYHGITVTVDPGLAPRCLSCFLEDVEVQPAALAEKFCAAGGYFAARSSRRVEHVFSELYQVPEDLRRGYLKVKILELLLFLSALEVPAQPQAAAPGLSRGQVSLARKTADYLLANTESKVTVQELSRHFGASAAQIQASFRGVYGRSPAAWLRLQKMHGAAELLRSTDRTVLDIAGQFGYDNASKFARAFRDVIGVSPNEYRSGLDQDSCAP